MQYFYFSQGWEGLSAGTVVTVSGGTAIIGTDAFVSAYDAVQAGIAAYGDYEETIYVDWQLATPDVFANANWDGTEAGDTIYIDVVNPDDPSEEYTGAIKLTYSTDAFSTITTARQAVAVGKWVQVVGGTFNDAHQGGSGSTARSWLFGRRLYVTDATIQFDGTVSTSLALASNSATNYDLEITVGKGGEILNGLYAGGAYAVHTGNATINVINGGYVYSAFAGGIGTNYCNATDVDAEGKYLYSITCNVVGGSIGTFTATSTGTTYADVIVNMKDATFSNYYLGNANTGCRLYGDAYISLDNSTITGTLKTGSSRSFNDVWFYGEVNVGVVGGTSSVGSLSIGTVKQLIDDVQVNVQPTVNITINGGAAVNFAAGSISASNVVNISINVEDYVASADKEQVLFLNGGGLQNANISIVGNNADKYTYSLENNNTKLFLNVKPTYISVAWADLADGTVVEIPGGSATIGTDAFATGAAAAAAGATNIQSLDIYLNSDYNSTDPIVISGYTATYGVDAFNSFADARTAYGAGSKLGAINLTGGTFSDGTTGTAATQYLMGYQTVMDGGNAALLIGGNSSGDAKHTDIVIRGTGTTVGTVYGGNRANTAIANDINVLVEDGARVSTLFLVYGAGLASADSIAIATLNNASANVIGSGAGTPVGSQMYINVISSTVSNGIGGSGAANSNVTRGAVTYNFSNSTIAKLYADRGIDANGGIKNAAVTGAVTVNVFGGGTTRVNTFNIYGTCSSASVNIAADSCLSVSSATIADYTTFTIDVEDYTPTSSYKLVFTGKSLSGYSISITGTDADKYHTEIDGTSLYLVRTPDAYISTRWSDLDDGDVVEIPGGTAVIGTNAFATYAEAKAAGADMVQVLDIYVNTDWSELAPGDTVVIGGYTATIGTDAFATLDSGLSGYAATTKTGALYLVGGTYTASTSMHTSGAAKQFANGYPTVIENSLISYLSAGWNANTTTGADLTIRGCSVTGGIGGGNRYYGTLVDGVITVEDSNVSWICPVSGPSLSCTGTVTVNVTGSSVGNVFNQGTVSTGTVIYNFTNSTFRNIAGAGSSNSSSANNVIFNLVSVTGGSFCATKGFDGGNWKACYVLGDMAINVSGGTSTFTYLEINDNEGGSRTITIDADSALIMSSGSIVTKTAFVINVDGYTPADGGNKLVFSGKNLASHNISIVGADASDYHTVISGTNLYIAHNSDAYVSVGWTGLDDGTVVEVNGGTAVIGTDAFAGIDAATAAGKQFVELKDIYMNLDWASEAAGTVETIVTPGGTVRATIGTNAFNFTSAGLNSAIAAAKASQGGVLHVAGGSTSGPNSNRIPFGGADTYITDTTIDTREVLGSTNTAITSGGYANVTIGEGSRISTYFVNREVFNGEATVTVCDGGYVANLYGACTNANFTGGTTTINVFGSTVGQVVGGGIGSVQNADIVMNFTDARINGNVTGHSNVQSSENSGSLVINATNTVIGGNVTPKGTGSSDFSGGIALNFDNVTATQLSLANATAYGDVTLDLKDTSLYAVDGVSANTGDYVANFDGSSITMSYYVYSNNGTGLSSDSMDIDIAGTTIGRYFYAAYDGTINGDYTFDVSDSNLVMGSVILNDGTVNGDLLVSYDNTYNGGNLRVIASGTVTGNVVVNISDVTVQNRLIFTEGSATIGGTYTAVISGDSDIHVGMDATQVDSLTVAEGATLAIGAAKITVGGTFANYGAITTSSESALSNYNTYGYTNFARNTSVNNGTVSLAGVTDSSNAIDNYGTLFVYDTTQGTVFVDSAYAGTETYEYVTIGGKDYRYGINVFSSLDEVTNTDINTQIVINDTINTDTYGIEGTIANGNFTKNVYGGAKITEAGTVSTDAQVEVSGGTFRGLVGGQRLEADVAVSGDSLLEISGGSGKAAFGGHYVAFGESTISGDTEAAISGGNFSSFVCGGNVVATGASIYLTGTSTLSITGGYFGNAVAGGSDSQGGDIDSDTDFVSRVEISGGTFANGVYGGNVASKAAYANFSGNTHSTLIDINGSTEIAVDVTGTNTVNFGASNVVAGSYGQGQVSGTSTVTFTGSAANLTFTGILTGDSQNGGTNSRMVMGNRSLVFEDFDGAFNAKINGFDTVSFANDSAMSFTSANVYLQNVTTWNFSNGSSLAWSTGRNDFSGDTLNLSFESLDSDWTILSGSETTLAGFDDFALVNINGVAADYDLVNNVYTAGDYQLYLDNNAMKLGTIA